MPRKIPIYRSKERVATPTVRTPSRNPFNINVAAAANKAYPTIRNRFTPVPTEPANTAVPRALAELSGELQKAFAEQQEKENKAYVSSESTRIMTQSLQEYEEAKNSAELGAEGFTENFMKAYDKKVEDALDRAPTPEARQALQETMTAKRLGFFERSMGFEMEQRAIQRGVETREGIQAVTTQVASGAMSMEEGMAQTKMQIEAVADELPVEQERALKQESLASLAESRMDYEYRENPGLLMENLKAGKYSGMVDSSAISKYMNKADREIKRKRDEYIRELGNRIEDQATYLLDHPEESADALRANLDQARNRMGANSKEYQSLKTEVDALMMVRDKVGDMYENGLTNVRKNYEEILAQGEGDPSAWPTVKRAAEQYAKKADDVNEQIVEDSGSFVVENDEVVGYAYSNMQTTEENEGYTSPRLKREREEYVAAWESGMNQRKVGARNLLPNRDASRLVMDINNTSTGDRTQILNAYLDSWPERVRSRVFGELVDSGLDPYAGLALNYKNEGYGQLSQTILEVGEKVQGDKIDDFRGSFEKGVARDVEDEVVARMKDYEAGIWAQSPFGDDLEHNLQMQSVVTNMALFQMKRNPTLTAGQAAEQAYNKLIGDQFDFMPQPNQTPEGNSFGPVPVPKHVAGEPVQRHRVRSMMKWMPTKTRLEEFNPVVPESTDPTMRQPEFRKERKENLIRAAVENGQWVLNERRDGMRLEVDIGETSIPIKSADTGEYFGFKFTEAEVMLPEEKPASIERFR